MVDVTVVGSVNLDLVASVARLPRPGETITDATLGRHPGGKGANQALAAARAGAGVRLVAAVGTDPEAVQALRLLHDAGVDLSHVARVDTPTGIALIAVDSDGENQIVVAPGANRALSPAHVPKDLSGTVVCQLEVATETVATALGAATLGVLNCAPARELPDDVLASADVVVVNETERDFYGAALSDHRLCVVTLGAEGAIAMQHGDEVASARPPAVDVIDTVGAGDSFVGYLSVALTTGLPLRDALDLAVAAGALATTIRGAQPSIPGRAAVDAIMQAP